MSKRGQATVFIILGILVLALFGLILYFRGDFVEGIFGGETSERFTSPSIEPVKDVVSECVKVTLLDAVEHVSNRGGYFDPVPSEDYSKSFGDLFITYTWHSQFGTRLPSLNGLGNQLKLYMEDHRSEIEECINQGIGDYKRSWDIRNINDFSLDSPQISENYIRQRIYYGGEPLSVKKGDYAATTKEIMAELGVALGQAQRLAADIAGCFNGDFGGPSQYNTFCDVDGVKFRAEVYNMRYYQNVVSMLHQDCSPGCDDCYHLYIPSQRGDIAFNVALKTC